MPLFPPDTPWHSTSLVDPHGSFWSIVTPSTFRWRGSRIPRVLGRWTCSWSAALPPGAGSSRPHPTAHAGSAFGQRCPQRKLSACARTLRLWASRGALAAARAARSEPAWRRSHPSCRPHRSMSSSWTSWAPNASSTNPSKSRPIAFVLPCSRRLVSPCPSEAGRAE